MIEIIEEVAIDISNLRSLCKAVSRNKGKIAEALIDAPVN